MIYNSFKWFLGVVEDRNDPLKLGRVKVRCFGYHTEQKTQITTDQLPWANVSSSGISSGVGKSPDGIIEGSHVFGVFIDPQLQDLIVLGVIPGLVNVEANPQLGFNDARVDPSADPNIPATVTINTDGSGSTLENQAGKNHPLASYKSYTDANHLATGENTDNTIVAQKQSSTVTNIRSVGVTFNEPVTPYAPEYPHNHVYSSESGHHVEFDDTVGAERVHIYHRSGSFEEIHPNGDRVTKTVNDKYDITHKDDNQYVMGEQKVTVQKGKKLVVNSEDGSNQLEIDVGSGGNMILNVLGGNFTQYINGNVQQDITGNVVANIGGTADLTVVGNTSLTTPTFNITASTTNISGALNVGGATVMTGNVDMQGAATVGSTLAAGTDVTAGAISLVGHTHPYTDNGSPKVTSPPI
jgi:hypothetical protein